MSFFHNKIFPVLCVLILIIFYMQKFMYFFFVTLFRKSGSIIKKDMVVEICLLNTEEKERKSNKIPLESRQSETTIFPNLIYFHVGFI